MKNDVLLVAAAYALYIGTRIQHGSFYEGEIDWLKRMLGLQGEGE